MHSRNRQLFVTLAAVIFLMLLTDPFMVFMPDMAQMVVLVVATGFICGWAGLVLQERDGDEREVAHRMFAGRAGYLSGIAILTIALVFQGFTHTLDTWIPVSLGIMIAAKYVARAWLDTRA